MLALAFAVMWTRNYCRLKVCVCLFIFVCVFVCVLGGGGGGAEVVATQQLDI